MVQGCGQDTTETRGSYSCDDAGLEIKAFFLRTYIMTPICKVQLPDDQLQLQLAPTARITT